MDDHQRSDGIPVTRFTLQSIYAQSDDEKLQFEYESGNTKILVRWYLCSRSNSQHVAVSATKRLCIKKLIHEPYHTYLLL